MEAVSGKKKLRIKKYPHMYGRGLHRRYDWLVAQRERISLERPRGIPSDLYASLPGKKGNTELDLLGSYQEDVGQYSPNMAENLDR